MNNHLPTLLLREWMQHKRGWLIAALLPPLLFLAALPCGSVQGLPKERLELMALMITVISAAAVYGICLLVALFQLPGLARRDTQDRSIEFWLSLPGRPSESVAATVLAHGWLADWGQLGEGIQAIAGRRRARRLIATYQASGTMSSRLVIRLPYSPSGAYGSVARCQYSLSIGSRPVSVNSWKA